MNVCWLCFCFGYDIFGRNGLWNFESSFFFNGKMVGGLDFFLVEYGHVVRKNNMGVLCVRIIIELFVFF